MPIVPNGKDEFELRCISNHQSSSMVQINTGANNRSFACKTCGYVETYLTEVDRERLNSLPLVETPP